MKQAQRALPLRAWEVRAILEGRKTRLSRPVKPPKCATLHGRTPMWERAWVDPGGALWGPGPYLKLPYGGGDFGDDPEDWPVCRVFSPFGTVGDRLWCRETFRIDSCRGSGTPEARFWLRYAVKDAHGTDTRAVNAPGCRLSPSDSWRSSTSMPRWASRLTLEVTGVRVERVSAITEADARAEGIPQTAGEAEKLGLYDMFREPGHEWDNRTSVENFARLWASLHGPDAWERGGWCWAVEFRRVEG